MRYSKSQRIFLNIRELLLESFWKVLLERCDFEATLFHKHQIDCGDKEEKSQNMIPPDLNMKRHHAKHHKHHKSDHLLHHLQLYQRKWSAVAFKTYPIRRHLKTILKQCYPP